jgi:uncharacterized Zn finger protein (UPF0148 family)
MPDTTVKMKVCEACGALWYRRDGDLSPYCGGCEIKLRDFPTAESRKRRGRKPKKRELTGAEVCFEG